MYKLHRYGVSGLVERPFLFDEARRASTVLADAELTGCGPDFNHKNTIY